MCACTSQLVAPQSSLPGYPAQSPFLTTFVIVFLIYHQDLGLILGLLRLWAQFWYCRQTFGLECATGHCTQLTHVDVAHMVKSLPMTMSSKTLSFYLTLKAHAKRELMNCSFHMVVVGSYPWPIMGWQKPFCTSPKYEGKYGTRVFHVSHMCIGIYSTRAHHMYRIFAVTCILLAITPRSHIQGSHLHTASHVSTIWGCDLHI